MSHNANLKIYFIAYRPDLNNHRMRLIYSLKEYYSKMLLVSTDRKGGNNHAIKIPPIFGCPLRVLDRIGLVRVRRVLEEYMYFPSRRILYVKAAQRELSKLIQGDIDQSCRVCVINSLPHHDLGLVGLYLKKKFPSVKWIVDWRDLWSYDKRYFDRTPKIYQKRLKRVEHEIISLCDMNVTTNDAAMRILEKCYNVPADNIVSIEHAFYREDVECQSASMADSNCESGGTINIGFLGTLSKPPKVSAVKVLNAIKAVKASGIDVALNIYGDNKEETRVIVDKSFSGIAFLHKRQSHRKSLRRIADSDFLLLALEDIPNCQIICHAKLPHYLLIGKPILAMVPEKSYVANVIRETNTGFVIPPDENCARIIVSILKKYKKSGIYLKRNEDIIQRYSWTSISNEWIDTINRVCFE